MTPVGPCPAPEALAAWAAGGVTGPERDSLDAHVAVCPACRWEVSEPADEAERALVPARWVARALAVVRSALRPEVSLTARAPRIRYGAASPWLIVPLSAAAGLAGGLVAVRWFYPNAPAPAESSAVERTVPEPSLEEVRTLARRQAFLESRAVELDRRLADRVKAEEAVSVEAKALAGSLEEIRADVAVLAKSVQSLSQPAPAAPVPDAAAVRALGDRLALVQESLGRLQADVDAVRRAHESTAGGLAEAREAQARQAEQVRALQEKLSGGLTAPAAPPADCETLLASVRQGSREESQRALASLRAEGLDVLGHAVAYYSRETPKEVRALAGDELSRRGAKGVDHDLILALAHGHVAVRREASALLAKNRTRGQDFGFQAAAAAEDRQRALLKAVRWWENEYRDDFPERALIQQGALIIVPAAPVPVRPAAGATPPAPGLPAPVAPTPPPQYNPPR